MHAQLARAQMDSVTTVSIASVHQITYSRDNTRVCATMDLLGSTVV